MNSKENRLVVADAGWAETIPSWLLDEIRSERLTLGLLNILDPGSSSVGDAELCAYLYTLSLRQPLTTDYTGIYIYLTATLMKRKDKSLVDFMEEKLKQGLTREEVRKLDELRNTIHRIRGEINHPVLDVLRKLKKGFNDQEETESTNQLTIL
ncbi:hypothetical protein HZA73_09500 [candidate division TA06 bacterium]|nr:hypothetical protein [candidate division TA06 bacterium]